MTPLLLFSACLLGLYVSPPSSGLPTIAIEAYKIPADSLNAGRESSCSLQEQTLDLLYNQALRYLENNELGALAVGIVAASEGWQVVYLGPNLPADEIAAAVKKVRAKAVALSLVWPEGNQDVDAEIHRWRNQRGSAVALIVGGRAAAFEGRFRRDVSEFKLTPNFSRIEMFDYIFTFKGFEYVKIIFAPGRVPGTVNLLVFKQTYERFKSPTELYLATELNAVQQMSPEELDLMSYGVITLDKEDRVTADNDWEARLAGASRYQVMHQHWFKRPAPCTRVDEFEGRYRAFKNGARSEMFNFIFPFSRGAQFINRTFLPARDYGSVNIVVFKRKLII